MIKKIIIEQDDKQELLKWKTDRFDRFMERIDFLKDDEQEYIVSLDVAKSDSTDNSIMMQFRLVDGKLIYEGYEAI